MKAFFSFLVCCCVAVVSSSQVVNYQIDTEFSVGDMYRRSSISSILNLNEGLLISANTWYNDSPERGITYISDSGNFIDALTGNEFGPLNIANYKGDFLSWGMQIARFDLAGDLLDFYFEYKKPQYSGFISTQINATLSASDPEENILVGGIFFTDSTDISPNSLRQLCMIDSTGAPILDFPMVKCEPTNAKLHSIDTLSTGEYIIAGSFSSVNGHPANNIAKLHSDFSVDTTFVSVFGNQGTAVVGEIDSIDRIWVRIGNGYLSSNPDSLVYFLRLLPNGEVDTVFHTPIFTSYYDEFNPFETGPAAMALMEDNTILLGGNFVEVNGEYHKTMVQLYDDGSIVEGAFANLGADEAVWPGWQPALGPIAGTYIRIIEKLPGGKLLLGGSFSSFGGESYNCLVRLKPDGFVGLEENERRGKLTVYPNPARESIHIRLPDKNQRLTRVEFYDLSGRLVKQVNNLSENKAIDVSDLTDGLYLVEGITGEGTFCGKVVINQK